MLTGGLTGMVAVPGALAHEAANRIVNTNKGMQYRRKSWLFPDLAVPELSVA